MAENTELELVEVDANKVAKLKEEIDFKNPTLTVSYGAQTMQQIGKFADGVLEKVKLKDSGVIGNDLTALLGEVNKVNVTDLANGQKKNLLASLPVIGHLFDTVKKTLAQYDSVANQVQVITQKLEDSQIGLLRDIEVLEQLYEHNSEFYADLTGYIKAGEERLEHARTVELPALEQKAKESADNFQAQEVRDFAENLNRFERRLHDLKLSRTITLQTAPQIRMIQNNDRVLAEKIQTSILTTIPVWKNQLVLALSIHNQQQTVNLQKAVTDTTNSLLSKNAEMLKTATLDTAREVERGIVDINTLKDVQGKLLSTIEETITIASNGHQKRLQVEKELSVMEDELRTKLLELSSQKAQQVVADAKDGGQDAVLEQKTEEK